MTMEHDLRQAALLQPKSWYLVDPHGVVQATERTQIKAWARISGYKPTVENLLAYEQNGWRVLPDPASLPPHGGSELHAAILNLPCAGPKFLSPPGLGVGYEQGHRDARHAAAELVVAALSAIEAVQEKGEKGNLVHLAGRDLPAASGSDVPARPTSPADERALFETLATARGLDISFQPDAWGIPRYRHSHLDAMWTGWLDRSVLDRPPVADPGQAGKGETK